MHQQVIYWDRQQTKQGQDKGIIVRKLEFYRGIDMKPVFLFYLQRYHSFQEKFETSLLRYF